MTALFPAVQVRKSRQTPNSVSMTSAIISDLGHADGGWIAL